MAIQSTSFHTRSISLPSTSHPLDAATEDHLQRLRSFQADPSSSSSICLNMCGIKALYENMNDLISLPHNQKDRDIEDVLEGSLLLLVASSSALDVVSQMKESILDLQSSLRRGSSNEGIRAYLASRKKISKIASKCLAHQKASERNCTSSENDIILRMLKEAEAITLSALKSVLSFVTGRKASGWSMVTKLVKSKHVSCEKGSEVEEMDRALRSLSEKPLGADTKALLKQTETLEVVIHELQDALESVSRCLVKTRVSLLNVLTQ